MRGELVEGDFSFDTLAELLSFAGHQYPLGGSGFKTLYGSLQHEEVDPGLEGYVRAVMQSPPAFGAQLVRSLVLSQAMFQYRRFAPAEGESRYHSGQQLDLLRNPWPKCTLADLISKMEWYAGLAGNAFVFRNDARRRLYLMRPDRTVIAHASESDPGNPQWQLDSEVIGYLYFPNGFDGAYKVIAPEFVAHWSPLPDPLSPEKGMSWITPIVREMLGDKASTEHKLKYFELGATPNLVVKGIPSRNPDEFEEWVSKIDTGHQGTRNAYRTLYLTAGSDATVIGSKLSELDYKNVQGAAETRISVASRVPAPVLGISEGLAGSSLNAGNYGQSRRNFADIWLEPTLRSLAGTLAQIIPEPDGSQLWPDKSEMPFLREDAKDAADIEKVKAETIRSLVDGGFTPKSVVAAVQAQDMSLLEHTGRLSVQLLQDPDEPGTGDTQGGSDE